MGDKPAHFWGSREIFAEDKWIEENARLKLLEKAGESDGQNVLRESGREGSGHVAKIIKTDTQEAALKVIRGNIKVLTGINAVLNSRDDNSRIIISAGKRKVSLAVEKSFRDNVLKEIRRKMVAQTEALAKKNAIKLDEEDVGVLENLNGECSSKGRTEDCATQEKMESKMKSEI